MDTDPAAYRNKSVLILGGGNAAYESATAIHRHAAGVDMAARSRVRLAWETHYPGDVRTTNNEVLESYMLKSLDAVSETLREDGWSLRSEAKDDGLGSRCTRLVPAAGPVDKVMAQIDAQQEKIRSFLGSSPPCYWDEILLL